MFFKNLEKPNERENVTRILSVKKGVVKLLAKTTCWLRQTLSQHLGGAHSDNDKLEGYRLNSARFTVSDY